MSTIELRGVAKGYGATPVLHGLDLTVADGSITAILGASGSGKTTLLRLLAGFEHVDAGVVRIGGRVVDDGTRSVRPQHRGVGYVPQDGALFPHLTVMGNVAFGVPRDERADTRQLIELVGLEGLERRYPHQLSGGQQLRVALARALAVRPGVVLLDEPFSSLDASLRAGLRRDVARVLAEAGATTVIVTHDQDEALALADEVAVLRDGHVVACARPRALYGAPPDLAAATSVGEANVLLGEARGAVARCVLGTVALDVDGRAGHEGPARLLLRPEQLLLRLEPAPGAVAATVVDAQFHGHDAVVDVVVERPQRQELVARVPGDLPVTRGQRVWVEVRGPARAWALDVADPLPGDEALPGDEEGPATPRAGGGHRAARARSRRRGRILVGTGSVLVALGVVLDLVVGGGGPSPAAVGPVVFHASVQVTGRVRLTDPFTDKTTAKGVRSCAQAGTIGDQPHVGAHTWLVPTPPQSNDVIVEIGTAKGDYRGPGSYGQAVLAKGGGVMGIGTEAYALVSPAATATLTVHADGSGSVTFTHVPGDDDTPYKGWHGGISGSITWTCTS